MKIKTFKSNSNIYNYKANHSSIKPQTSKHNTYLSLTKRKRIQKGQTKMDNPEKLAIQGIQ